MDTETPPLILKKISADLFSYKYDGKYLWRTDFLIRMFQGRTIGKSCLHGVTHIFMRRSKY